MTASFLIDANLPPALAPVIRSLGRQAVHIADLLAAMSDDLIIWDLAKSRGDVIIPQLWPDILTALSHGEKVVEVR